MWVRKLVAVVILLELLGFAKAADAQGILPGGKTIGERLDDVGRTIFGGMFSENKENQEDGDTARNNKKIPRPTPGKYDPAQDSGDNTDSRGGTVIKPSNNSQQKTASESSSRSVRVYRSDSSASSQGATVSDNRPGRRYFEDTKVQDNAETPENTPLLPTASSATSRNVTRNEHNNPDGTAELSNQGNLLARPLHERLSQFRHSAFDDKSKGVLLDYPVKKVSDSPSPSISNPLSVRSDSSEPVASNAAAVNTTGRPTLAKRPAGTVSSDHPLIAERTSPTTRMDGTASTEGELTSKPKAAKEVGKFSASLETPAANENAVLFAHKGPALSVETNGPRKIMVGKESAYEVKIINSGDVAAEDLIVFVNLPEWADVIGMDASIGATEVRPPAEISAPFRWKAGHLEAKSQEKLVLHIVPRQSRPFDLAVSWEFKPAASQTLIEVQEPKLEMKLEGPREVYYGKKETYRLKLINSGTGNAEGVSIKFVPVGAGENVKATYELGVLPAGEDKLIEVELTARQSGMLEIQVEAKGDSGVHAELAEKVLVRRAGLEIGVDGPQLQFVGTTAAYNVRVRNPGNAPAKNINFTVALPAGLKYLGGIDGARIESSGDKLHWTTDSINPEAVQTFTIKCTPSAAGVSRVEVGATAEDDLIASAVAITQVESVANLALDVKDPGGPVPVGEEATYEIRVRNRGTKDAEGVEVIAYFSRGIEPTGAEGVANRLGQGQVVFTPISTLAPGAEITLKIHARADVPGNHVFRAEMHCKALGSRLVSEEATLYYQDALAIPQNLQARPPLDRSIR